MNTIAWGSFVLGNHEFDDGDLNLADFPDKLDVQVIAANVIPDAEGNYTEVNTTVSAARVSIRS